MQKDAIAQLVTGLAEGDGALEVLLAQALTRALGKVPEVPDMDALRHIRDWLKGALARGDAWLQNVDARGVPKKLAQIGSVERAFAMADKDMKRAANTLRSRFANAAAAFEKDEAAGHFETVHVFDDGSRMVRLLTSYALDSETAQLGHCIGNGGYDGKLRSGGHVYYSYRDALGRAHATLEVVDGVLEQCKGKENAPPVERYFKPIQDFIRRYKWKLTESVRHTGLLEKDGVYYDVANLPDGFTWEDTLLLKEAKWLKWLPQHMTVYGVLNLSGCMGLTALPDYLAVHQRLELVDCTGLTILPDKMNVRYCLNLIGCTKLRVLPSNLQIKGNLYLRDCTGLTALPDNLKVGGYLELDGCIGLTALPDNLYVGGSLSLSGCMNLVRLPQKMRVGGWVYWNGHQYASVADFRRAFKAKYPPENDNAVVAARRKVAGMRPA